MTFGGQRVTNLRRHAILDRNIATTKCSLRKSRRFESGLDAHSMIHNVRYELSMRLPLIQPAHDSEPHMHAALLHERRNNGMERPLAGSQRVRMSGIHLEQPSAILQRK